HAGVTDRASLLGLADESERRALLRADRIATALAAGHGHDAGLGAEPLAPLAEHRQLAGLVVEVRSDERHIQVGGILRRPGLVFGFGRRRWSGERTRDEHRTGDDGGRV